MKSLLALVPLAAFAILLGGCSTPSLNTLATPETTVTDEGLVGTWVEQEEGDDKPNEQYVITAGDKDAKTYAVKVVPNDKEKKALNVEIQIVKLGEHHFIDMTIPQSKRKDIQDYGTLVAPMHNFFKMKREGDTLTVWALDNKWLNTALKDGTLKLQYAEYGEDKDAVITASTKDLQEFFTKNAQHEKLFNKPGVLTRQKPAAK